MLYLVLAFVCGGVAEALVAFAAHHFHRKPTRVVLDAADGALAEYLEAEVQRRVALEFEELNKTRVEVPVDFQSAHRQGHWNRGEIKLMREIMNLADRHPAAFEALASVKPPPPGCVGPALPDEQQHEDKGLFVE